MQITDEQAREAYARFRAGDEAAFEELVAAYRHNLASYLEGFVNDRREADELAVDAFAELAANGNYRGESSLKTYLFSIGRHLALRHIKQYRYTLHIPVDAMIDEIGIAAETIMREERKEQLHAAMRKLKPDYREVLHLIYFEDMGYADAAKTMNKTSKQIDNLTHRAKASLKKLLAGEEGVT